MPQATLYRLCSQSSIDVQQLRIFAEGVQVALQATKTIACNASCTSFQLLYSSAWLASYIYKM